MLLTGAETATRPGARPLSHRPGGAGGARAQNRLRGFHLGDQTGPATCRGLGAIGSSVHVGGAGEQGGQRPPGGSQGACGRAHGAGSAGRHLFPDGRVRQRAALLRARQCAQAEPPAVHAEPRQQPGLPRGHCRGGAPVAPHYRYPPRLASGTLGSGGRTAGDGPPPYRRDGPPCRWAETASAGGGVLLVRHRQGAGGHGGLGGRLRGVLSRRRRPAQHGGLRRGRRGRHVRLPAAGIRWRLVRGDRVGGTRPLADFRAGAAPDGDDTGGANHHQPLTGDVRR